MANYKITNDGGIQRCGDTLSHANGWKKPNAKYIKRIPKPGGGFTYIYKESGLDARSNLGNAQRDFKKSLTTNRGMGGVAVNRITGTSTQIAKNRYDKTPAGKAENAVKNATSKAKSAINTGISKAKEAKVQYDKQQKKKKLDKALTELSPTYRTGKAVVEGTKSAANSVNKAIKDVKKSIDKKVDAVKDAVSNPVDTLSDVAKKKKQKRIKDEATKTYNKGKNKVEKALKKAKKKINKALK